MNIVNDYIIVRERFHNNVNKVRSLSSDYLNALVELNKERERAIL